MSNLFNVSIEYLIDDDDFKVPNLKSEHIQPKNQDKTKRIILEEYLFRIMNIDLTDLRVNYNLEDIKMHKIENGERITYQSPILELEVSAKNNDEGEYRLTFLLNADFSFFKKLNSRPKDITRYFLESETCLYDPKTKKYSNIEIPSEKKLYANPAHLWAAKLKDDIYFIKFAIPEQNIFLWFKIKF